MYKRWILLPSVFLLSLSLLSFEIALTRILAVLLTYHYVFLVVSLAMLGLGMGGFLIYLLQPRIPLSGQQVKDITFFVGGFSLSVSLLILLFTKVGYTEEILFYACTILIPFLFVGAAFALIFQRFAGDSSVIYGVDLAGAALGAFLAIIILNMFGGLRASLLIAVISTVAGLLLTQLSSQDRRTTVVAGLILIVTIGLFFSPFIGDIPVGEHPEKDIRDTLAQSTWEPYIAETRWSAFGRTDLVKYRKFPDWMVLFIDGAAGTNMYRFNGDPHHPDTQIARLKETFSGYFPYLFLNDREKDDALIIGAGGGKDVVIALVEGVKRVTAVEVNRDLVEIVRNYAEYNGGIYTHHEGIDVVIEEGRHFIKRSNHHYDLVVLTLPIIKSSRSYEGYALTENFLVTKEAVGDYLDHLTQEGSLIYVAHTTVELLRVLSLSLTALEEQGIDHRAALRRMYIVGSPEFPVLVSRKREFTPEESSLIYQTMKQMGYTGDPAYLPNIPFEQPGWVNQQLTALAGGKITWEGIMNAVTYDIHPVTDDRPFFYNFEKRLPTPITRLLSAAIAVVATIILLPLILYRLKQKERYAGKAILLFAMIGTGFLLIEVVLIQKFILFLGQPVLALAAMLFSLLIGAGLGSLSSSRLPEAMTTKGIAAAALLIAWVILSSIFILPLLFNWCLGWPLSARLVVAASLLISLGFMMGFPFPLGLRYVTIRGMERQIAWMWGINGATSVLGSVLAVVLSMNVGFTAGLVTGACCYLIVGVVFLRG